MPHPPQPGQRRPREGNGKHAHWGYEPRTLRVYELHTAIPIITRRQIMELMDHNDATVSTVIARAVADMHASQAQHWVGEDD